ncbi:MAG: hypothetical protein R3Y43_01410 [Alphaproteobacteria bacterium]
MAKKKKGVSIRSYAEHRGVSHSAIQKAIETGRIKTLSDGSIDTIQADKDWEENTNFAKSRSSFKPNAFADAQILKMKAEATLAQIKVKKEVGAVVPIDDVVIFLRVLTSDLSSYFLSLGRNIAPKMVGEKDIGKITRTIDDEIKHLIKEYKNDIENRLSTATAKIMDSEDY